MPSRLVRARRSRARMRLRRALSAIAAAVLLLAPRLAGAIPIHGESMPSIFDPRGRTALLPARLGIATSVLGGVIFVIVIVVLVIGIWRRREPEPQPDAARQHDQAHEQRSVVIFGLALPALVLGVLYVWSTADTTLLRAEVRAPVIEIVGHQWWWEVRYPEQQAITANEVHLPAGRTMRLRLTSADVIHSFWVPQIAGKMDLIPGDTNDVWVRADSVGIYLGTCAEYCGPQHAHMGFAVVVESPEQFARWRARQAEPAVAPDNDVSRAGMSAFAEHGCASCHAIRGSGAGGTLGPDLTHLASRHTIGAGTLPNTRGNLAGWVADPQHIKPGNRMPTTQLPGEDLQTLVAYLETLR